MTEHDYVKLNDGEKHVEWHGNTWVACADCGVLMRNKWGLATWIHGENCAYRYPSSDNSGANCGNV